MGNGKIKTFITSSEEQHGLGNKMITCTFENGHKASLRHVVVDSLLIKDGKILLVKRARHLTNAGKFALVGGYIQRDETLEKGALREIMEETGYKAKIKYLLRVKDSPQRPKEDRQNISFVYVVTVLERTGTKDNESSEIKWFNLNKLPGPEEFAFDHYQDIQLYLQRLKKPTA